MPQYVVKNFIKIMKNKSIKLKNSKILIMGTTFKENCPDMRNSKVPEIINRLKNLGCKIHVYDPWVNKEEFLNINKINLINKFFNLKYDAIIIAVAHKKFKDLNIEKYLKLCKKKHVIYDLKHILPKKFVDMRL
jgi:UDP-N-acetyl-D-glucosamine/UDP-N-acetyl-D-galactosamine dehydrogenase